MNPFLDEHDGFYHGRGTMDNSYFAGKVPELCFGNMAAALGGDGKTGHKKRAYEINVSSCYCYGSGGWIRTNDLRVMSPKNKNYLNFPELTRSH